MLLVGRFGDHDLADRVDDEVGDDGLAHLTASGVEEMANCFCLLVETDFRFGVVGRTVLLHFVDTDVHCSFHHHVLSVGSHYMSGKYGEQKGMSGLLLTPSRSPVAGGDAFVLGVEGLGVLRLQHRQLLGQLLGVVLVLVEVERDASGEDRNLRSFVVVHVTLLGRGLSLHDV